MNYFTKKKLITLAIVALIIINVTSLVTIWISQHRPIDQQTYNLPEDAKEATTFFLKNELQFSDEQVATFLTTQEAFLKENQRLMRQIGNARRDLYRSLIHNKKINETERYEIISRMTREKEEKTLKYFKELKALCNKNQQKKLDMLMGQILIRIDPTHRHPNNKNTSLPHQPPNRMHPTGQRPPHHLPGQRPTGADQNNTTK